MKSNLLKVETVCNHCGSTEKIVVTTGTDYEYGCTDDLFTFVRCRDCGLVYLNPRPDVSELPGLYPPEYNNYNIQTIYDERQRRSLYYKLRYKGFVSMLAGHLKEFFPDKRTLAILDIGCADGLALNQFRRVEGYDLETHGVDMSASSTAVAAACGHITYTGLIEDLQLPVSHFDLIYSSHVIEHVPDPRAFAMKVRTLLKPGGICWLWTPNVGSIHAQWFRNKYWGAYCFPRHFFLYDSNSMRRLAQESGFEVLKIGYSPAWPGWVMTMHNLCQDNKHLSRYAERLFSSKELTKITPWNILRNCFFTVVDMIVLATTGQTENMEAVLQKAPER